MAEHGAVEVGAFVLAQILGRDAREILPREDFRQGGLPVRELLPDVRDDGLDQLRLGLFLRVQVLVSRQRLLGRARRAL
jgi:hypothetical protein